MWGRVVSVLGCTLHQRASVLLSTLAEDVRTILPGKRTSVAPQQLARPTNIAAGQLYVDLVNSKETATEDALDLSASPCGFLGNWLHFRNPELETVFLLGQAANAIAFDKVFVLLRMVFTTLVVAKLDTSQYMWAVLLSYAEQFLQAYLLWIRPSFHLQHRPLLNSAFKSVRLLIVPSLPSAFRVTAASWWGVVQLLLMQSDVGGGLLNLFCFSSTFRADMATQVAYVITMTGILLRAAHVEGSFCNPPLEGLLGRVHAAMQHGCETILQVFMGGGGVNLHMGSSYRDPCLAIAVFAQVYLVGLLPLVVSWGLERSFRIRWWQRHTGRSVAPEAAPWWFTLLHMAAALLVNGVILFMAINIMLHVMPWPHLAESLSSARHALHSAVR